MTLQKYIAPHDANWEKITFLTWLLVRQKCCRGVWAISFHVFTFKCNKKQSVVEVTFRVINITYPVFD